MIKTIQIAAVMLAVCAIAALVGAVSLGVRPDAGRMEALAQPGVVEELKKTAAAPSGQAKTSPLVLQAQSLTKRINPPPPPKPVETNVEGASAGSKLPPPPPPANFEVVATAVHPVDASKSYALLSQPGKGFFWVKPNDEVNRAVIKQILPGKIVTMDGREYVTSRPQRPNLLKPGSPPPPGHEDYGPSLSTSGPPPAPRSVLVSPVAAEEPEAVSPQMSPEEVRASIEWLKAAMDDPESIGLTKEEAAQLGSLGEMLKDLAGEGAESGTQGQDPNAVPAGGSEGSK